MRKVKITNIEVKLKNGKKLFLSKKEAEELYSELGKLFGSVVTIASPVYTPVVPPDQESTVTSGGAVCGETY